MIQKVVSARPHIGPIIPTNTASIRRATEQNTLSHFAKEIGVKARNITIAIASVACLVDTAMAQYSTTQNNWRSRVDFVQSADSHQMSTKRCCISIMITAAKRFVDCSVIDAIQPWDYFEMMSTCC